MVLLLVFGVRRKSCVGIYVKEYVVARATPGISARVQG